MNLLPTFMLVDALTLSRPGAVIVNDFGGLIDDDPDVIASNVPCRLDRIEFIAISHPEGTRREAKQIVYAPIDTPAQINDFVRVVRPDGSEVDGMRIKAIDRPGLFRPSHLEIEIHPIGEVA